MSLDHFKHTLDDVAVRTSLKPDFINRAHVRLSGFFNDYRAYGTNNQVRFSDSGLMLWDRIAQLKQDNKSLPEIAQALDRDLQSRLKKPAEGSDTGSDTLQKGLQNGVGEGNGHSRPDGAEIDRITKLYERFLNEKQETINTMKTTLAMLLPAGKTPEEVKADLDKKEELALKVSDLERAISEKEGRERDKAGRRQALVDRVASLGFWRGKERGQLLEEIKKLDL